MIDEGFDVDAATLGRPDGHQPSEANWAEGHVLCIYCHVQVPEGVFFLLPCPEYPMAPMPNKETVDDS